MLDMVGPQNACIGLGQVMLERGHKVYFLVNEEFGDKFSKYRFEQRFLKKSESRVKPTEDGVDPIKKFSAELMEAGFFQNLSSLEKLKNFNNIKFFEEIYLNNLDFEPQVKELIETEKPDFLVVDSDIVAPCLLNAGIPWTYLFCSQPLGFFNSPDLPPFTSGYPVKGDRKQWEEFRVVQQKVHFDNIIKYQKLLCEVFNYPFDNDQKFIPHSPYLNIYQYPEELDYKEIQIPDHFLRVDAFCRQEVGKFELPEQFARKIKPNAKLIYLSMGSMGSVDVKLMKRLVAILAQTPHYYIVSRGLLHDQYELADNMWGEVYIPQTQILPIVDLVITHGGNNTVTEAFSFGKPMVVLPLFYDQFCNSQRLHETGYGVRLDTYAFDDSELVSAIDRLLNDKVLKGKLTKASERIRNTNSKLNAVLAIEKIVETATK